MRLDEVALDRFCDENHVIPKLTFAAGDGTVLIEFFAFGEGYGSEASRGLRKASEFEVGSDPYRLPIWRGQGG